MINKRLGFILFLCFALYIDTTAQVLPIHKSDIHYRLVGFSVPEKEGATKYEFEISKHNTNNEGKEEYIPILKRKVAKNSMIATMPEYGKTYVWKVNYYKGDELIESSDNYVFITKSSFVTDTSKYRQQVVINELKSDDLYFLLDGKGVISNADGEVLWYMPNIPEVKDSNTVIRDLKITPDNTFTFVTRGNIYEIDYNANVLWSGPNNGEVSSDSIENYHHEFTKFTNGHYMTLGQELISRKIPGVVIDSVYRHEAGVIKKQDGYYKQIQCGTILEYDRKGNLVWSWKSSEHFTDADLFTQKTFRGTVNTNTHMNSFYFDQIDSVIYVGYRDINRMMKISYPSGKILVQYGDDYPDDHKIYGQDIFYSHHNNTLNSDGHILLFNNNVNKKNKRKNAGVASSILILEESKTSKAGLNILWKFNCNSNNSAQGFTRAGGGVFELRDKSMLVAMGIVNRVFLVTNTKKIVWDIITDVKDIEGIWQPLGNYRASAIETKSQLEGLLLLNNN